jgi:pyruvate-formate lyase-activating enzyme
MTKSVVTYEDYLRAHFRDLGALIIEIGSYCPVECRHCHVSSDRSTTTYLTNAQIQTAITSFSGLSSSSFVSFTGGEPFVYKKRLITALACAKEHGLFTYVLTSAHWAKDDRTASLVLRDIDDRIDLLGFSVDQYHLEKQPLERTLFGLKAAIARSMNVFVALGSFGSQDPIRAIVREAIKASSGPAVQIVNYPLLPRGKGAGLPELKDIDLTNEPNESCLSVGTPVVTSTGVVAACCHTNVANDARAGNKGPLVLGTIDEAENVWSSYANSRYTRLIRDHGPIRVATEYNVALPLESKHWDICKVCDFVRDRMPIM